MIKLIVVIITMAVIISLPFMVWGLYEFYNLFFTECNAEASTVATCIILCMVRPAVINALDGH